MNFALNGRDGSRRLTHEESLVYVHGSTLELAFSYLVPCLPGLREKYYPQFQKKQTRGELPVIKGLVSLFAKDGWKNFPNRLSNDKGDTSFTISIPSDIAREMRIHEAPIHDFAETDNVNGAMLIHVTGSMGLSRFQGAILSHINSLPLEKKFSIPFGLDTEVFVRPQKFGFREPSA